MSEKENQETEQPAQELTTEELDQVNGGLLPAVQKVREAAQKVHPGGVNVALGDGSVRFVK